MKKVTTILKQINELENELYKKHTIKEILDGFDKIDKEGVKYSITSLLYVIYEGVYNADILENEFPDEEWKGEENGKKMCDI